MTCKKGATYINKYGDQDISKCKSNFENKQCECYAKMNTKKPNEEQICGFMENGFFFHCDVGCCNDGCPGQCPGIESRPPYAMETQGDTATVVIIGANAIRYTIYTIFFLIILSTLSLFVK